MASVPLLDRYRLVLHGGGVVALLAMDDAASLSCDHAAATSGEIRMAGFREPTITGGGGTGAFRRGRFKRGV